jgi:Predicted Zn-dependent hydrolases of the beta-lactamase fold
MIRINYLYHSGFAVETEKYFFIFDYFMDSVENGEEKLSNGVIRIDELPKDKSIIVFSSHSHGDHFNPLILQWKAYRPDIKYVLSSDISIEEESDNIYIMDPYEEVELDSIRIKSFGSTDLGVSYLLKLEDCSIFHAGDLNWWYWWDDTPEEIERAETWFKDEIRKIEEETVDIAFFPVDQRLEHNYCIGAKYFIEKLKPKYLIPMHFGDNYETTVRFNKEIRDCSTKVIEITHRGQEILLQ